MLENNSLGHEMETVDSTNDPQRTGSFNQSLRQSTRESPEMNDDFMKRDFLLPEGCKDLIDVPKYKQKAKLPLPGPLPPITGEMAVGDQMSIHQLATLLKQTPYRIVADLIELGVFVRLEDQVEFALITKVLRKYGIAAKKA